MHVCRCVGERVPRSVLARLAHRGDCRDWPTKGRLPADDVGVPHHRTACGWFVRPNSALDVSHGCCSNVTVHLPSRFVSSAWIDRRLGLWLGFLAALAGFNGAIWIWI